MDLPGNNSFTLEYDVAGRLSHIRHNGNLVDAQYMAGIPVETQQTAIAMLQQLLDEISTKLLPAANAQVSLGGRVIPRPPTDPMQSLGPFGGIERGYRSVAEALIRVTQCQCDLNKGHDKPTVTTATKLHLTLSGHAFRLYSDQSYFTVPMSQYQQLVDAAATGASYSSQGTRRVYRATAPLLIGQTYLTGKDLNGIPIPGFTAGHHPTMKYTVVVETAPCGGRDHDYNKVITMYPGWSANGLP